MADDKALGLRPRAVPRYSATPTTPRNLRTTTIRTTTADKKIPPRSISTNITKYDFPPHQDRGHFAVARRAFRARVEHRPGSVGSRAVRHRPQIRAEAFAVFFCQGGNIRPPPQFEREKKITLLALQRRWVSQSPLQTRSPRLAARGDGNEGRYGNANCPARISSLKLATAKKRSLSSSPSLSWVASVKSSRGTFYPPPQKK